MGAGRKVKILRLCCSLMMVLWTRVVEAEIEKKWTGSRFNSKVKSMGISGEMWLWTEGVLRMICRVFACMSGW